jgi:hypothetical protein
MVKELEMHLSALLNAANISLDDVDFTRADFITGADHGKGAFQVGVKVVLPFEHKSNEASQNRMPAISIQTPKSRPESIIFDVSIANCRSNL